jgi:hypothetical protein
MLVKLQGLLKTHFEYQQHVMNQSLRPFLPKIASAESNYKVAMDKFLTKRMAMKEQVKESAGLGNIERQVKKSFSIFESPTNSPIMRRSNYLVSREDKKKADEQLQKE